MQYRPRRDVSNVLVRAVVGDEEELASVRNVTTDGLQIRVSFEEAEVGDPILLTLRGRTFRGRIVWMSETATGLRFDQLLKPADIAMFTGRPDRTSGHARHRVGFNAQTEFRR